MTKLKMMQRKFISHRKLKPRKTRGKTRGDGSLVSCPNQFSPHFINGRSAKADRCGSSTGTIKLLTERPMCERDCTIRQHPLYFLLTFWLKLGKE